MRRSRSASSHLAPCRPNRRAGQQEPAADQTIRCATMSTPASTAERLEVDRKHAPQAVGRDAQEQGRCRLSSGVGYRCWCARFICRAPSGGERAKSKRMLNATLVETAQLGTVTLAFVEAVAYCHQPCLVLALGPGPAAAAAPRPGRPAAPVGHRRAAIEGGRVERRSRRPRTSNAHRPRSGSAWHGSACRGAARVCPGMSRRKASCSTPLRAGRVRRRRREATIAG